MGSRDLANLSTKSLPKQLFKQEMTETHKTCAEAQWIYNP
jgi:hypothetical protein